MTRDDFLAPMQATAPTPAPLPLTQPPVSLQVKIGQYADYGDYSPGALVNHALGSMMISET